MFIMKGIRLNHGATFVEYKGVPVRISQDGECTLSPVLFSSLEWELRTEPPHTWEYITDGDIRAMGDEIFKNILGIVEKYNSVS